MREWTMLHYMYDTRCMRGIKARYAYTWLQQQEYSSDAAAKRRQYSSSKTEAENQAAAFTNGNSMYGMIKQPLREMRM